MNLILNDNGRLVDESTGELFLGVAPRDLSEGDTFQQRSFAGLVTARVTHKEITEDGMIFVECEVVS